MIRSVIFAAALGITSMLAGSTSGPTAALQPMQPAKTRVGVFDSRLVALAYYNTAEYRGAMQQMMTDLREAKAANNQGRVKELEFQGPALQNLMHYQVFSTASIPNVTERLGDVLPRVAADAGVSVIVSKWEISYALPDVEYVDVTDALVKTFNPDARVQRFIDEGKTKKPIPLLEAVKTMRADQ